MSVDLRELLERAAGTPHQPPDTGWVFQRAAQLRRRTIVACGLAVALVAALAGVIALPNEESSVRVPPAIPDAESGIPTQDGAPRVLIGSSGWRMTRIDAYLADEGEMEFSDGETSLTLYWFPTEDYDAWRFSDRVDGAESTKTVTVLGQTSTLVKYRGRDIYTTLWRLATSGFEAHGQKLVLDGQALGSLSLAEYEQVVESLRVVDQSTWQAALPANAVIPADRPPVVRAMLEDVPLPSGFDAVVLEGGTRIRDRYQLGAVVTGAVACAWIKQWFASVDAGDAASAQEAVTAIATSRQWSILNEMNAAGAWSESVWAWARFMAGDRTGLHLPDFQPGNVDAILGCDITE